MKHREDFIVRYSEEDEAWLASTKSERGLHKVLTAHGDTPVEAVDMLCQLVVALENEG